MSAWQPIETAPKDGTAVLVYFSRLEFVDSSTGGVISFGALRDYVERVEVGFYEDGRWLQSGTAHDFFEPWRDATQMPTHWMPLPEPPETGEP